MRCSPLFVIDACNLARTWDANLKPQQYQQVPLDGMHGYGRPMSVFETRERCYGVADKDP
jgi:hypothetical protein